MKRLPNVAIATESATVVRLVVRAKPRAKKSRIVRVDGLSIDVALAAMPVEGAANRELLSVLADALGVAPRDVRLLRGAGSRNKVVEVHGLEASELSRRLSATCT